MDNEAWSGGDSRDRCARVIKRPPLSIFSFFAFYLRHFKFAKARDFAIYTESNFSYSVKSSLATNARFFNKEENRSFIKKVGVVAFT